MAYSKFYFIFHIDVYQVNNTSNVGIDPPLHNLTTNQKVVDNSIIHSGISNDTDGSRQLFVENWYAAPKTFSFMVTNHNIRSVRTFRTNRKFFSCDQLHMDNKD